MDVITGWYDIHRSSEILECAGQMKVAVDWLGDNSSEAAPSLSLVHVDSNVSQATSEGESSQKSPSPSLNHLRVALDDLTFDDVQKCATSMLDFARCVPVFVDQPTNCIPPVPSSISCINASCRSLQDGQHPGVSFEESEDDQRLPKSCFDAIEDAVNQNAPFLAALQPELQLRESLPTFVIFG
jgi:hypothetical protein